MNHGENFEISVGKLVKKYEQGQRELLVLKEISVTFRYGLSYALTGVSGSGKSTFLQVIGGIDAPTSGSVRYGNADIFSLKPWERDIFFNKHIGFVFQFHYLIKELSVLHNVMLPGLIAGMSKKDAAARAHEILDYCDIANKHEVMPWTLSGGEQQRVAIARAIFNKPKFLLADEPTGSLDSANVQRIIELFVRCQREWGMGLIVCSHDEHVAQSMEHVYHLENGVLQIKK